MLTVCCLLALAVWGVFGQTLRHDFVNYDDPQYVYEQPVVLEGLSLSGFVWAFTHSHSGNWHPLTSISHMADCQLYGLNSFGHHLTNLLLHTATTILLFLILYRMTGALWRSAFVAAVFALHPLRVESVAWISERKDVLSGLFFMLTLDAYVRYARRPFSAGRYAVMAVFFALGLMTKPMLVTLPFLLLLLDYWPLKRAGIPFRRLIAEKIPLLLLSAFSCSATVWAQQHTVMPLEKLPFLSRLGNAAASYLTYIVQTVYPSGLAVVYPHPGSSLPLWKPVLALAVLTAVTGFVLTGWKKRPWLLTGWFWYLGMLVPVIDILQVGVQAHADRYTYLPQIGLLIMVAWTVADCFSLRRAGRTALSVAATAIVVVLMLSARVQTAHWCDSVSLWSHTLESTTSNFVAHSNLGTVLAAQGKTDEAIAHFERAIQIDPSHGEIHNNLGVALAGQGRYAEAVPHYVRAIQLRPGLPEPRENLTDALNALKIEP